MTEFTESEKERTADLLLSVRPLCALCTLCEIPGSARPAIVARPTRHHESGAFPRFLGGRDARRVFLARTDAGQRRVNVFFS